MAAVFLVHVVHVAGVEPDDHHVDDQGPLRAHVEAQRADDIDLVQFARVPADHEREDDPDRAAYHVYGLYQGTAWQTLFSPRIWLSNRRLARQKGYKPELPPAGQDAYQMSGTFIIGTDGKIRLPYYYEDIADHPSVDLILHGIMGVDWNRPYDSKPVA